MNNLNNSADEVVECPLCMEPLEVDDLNFFPCTCGYQICRFCWHRIRTDENELCPACRKEYPENPADFKPLTQEEMIAFKSQKRQRDQQRKQKITENRKHLANVRVVQKNLVFVVGLPPRLADADILKKHEYFGKYGKIHKVVINPSTAYAGVQGPSASAYVTYVHNTDALRAIQSVNNIMIDGRLIKTSLGTTKYCSHFMKNQQCPKGDCMYLHELGDPEASFTKEEMHQGKHQEYEKRLHDALIASAGNSSSGCGVSIGSTSSLNNSKNSDSCKVITSQSQNSSQSSTTVTTSVGNAIQKEAWPSLSLSPVSQKESISINNKNRKDRAKQDKNKSEKNTKTKNIKNNSNNLDMPTFSNSTSECAIDNSSSTNQSSKSKDEKNKEKNLLGLENRSNSKKESSSSTIVEDVIKDFSKSTSTIPSAENVNGDYFCNKTRNVKNVNKIVDNQRSFSSSSNSSCVINTSENNPTNNESVSGKSSPGSFNENNLNDEHTRKLSLKYERPLTPSSVVENKSESNVNKKNLPENRSEIYGYVEHLLLDGKNNDHEADKINLNEPQIKNNLEKDSVTDAVSKLNLLDENSFFTSTKGILQQSSVSLKSKNIDEIVHNQLNSGTVPNLPDLINGIDGYQNTSNEYQTSSNNYLAGSDLNRQSNYMHYQQQSNESSSDNLLQNTLFGTNMSKFFDFHKHQQQKLQQQCLQITGSNNINSSVNENLVMMPLMENTHHNSQLVDQNCILNTQNHQKQKLFGKIDQMLCHQTLQQLPNQHIGSLSSQQTQYIHSATGDDELGFDPFIETQKALAELIENEEEQQQSGTNSSKLITHKNGSNPLQNHQQHVTEFVQRARMPPPGFNHVTNFNGYGVVPRIQNSKIMPFMNVSSNYAVPTSQHIQHQQQLQIPSNAWGSHLGNFQQQINEQQMRQVNSNPMQNTSNQKGYTGNDWTAMDPAILSFRQFSFPHQTQITPQMQPQQQELFLQQLAQQQSGFNSQPQHSNSGNGGIANSIMNSQQNSQPHVNANVQGMLEYLKTRQFV